ncbi:putative iron-only hydrogenase system regulator [Fusobacterium gonidiaformans 3-1-5R]|uniref:Putative iron-only hydrogenase system regulator n=1 Tax=Fusobacterium gonidiaformans 3-1-5R TaxID=469605 RepID=E5BDZ7_9FUSO|nr:TM1266 family iron-only hydrogenase system putative regulator [Fusobacterium gonidiaformans]EFS21273.1 putative iron-only hydrogenase system regulator [Fusobacterium gonidiaformans 3-1-5R]
MKKRVAVISAILENAIEHQVEFNDVIAKFQKNIHGRMGIPFHQEGISVVSITMIGSMDEINSFTGKLGSIDSVQVKTAISKKEIEEVC